MFSKSSQDFCSSNTIAAALHKPGEPRSLCERERERGPILAQEFTKSYKIWFQRSRSFVGIELLPREEHPFPKLRANRRLSTLPISPSNARRRCNRGLANQPCGLPLGCSRFAFILSRENSDRNNNHPRTLIQFANRP